MVPRAQRLVLRAQRGHRRGAARQWRARRKRSRPLASRSIRSLPRNKRRRFRRPNSARRVKILYIINTGKKKSGKAIDRLLEIPRVHLTITVGRDAELKEKLVAAHGGIRPARARAGLDQPNAPLDAEPSSGGDQGGRGDGAGSHRRPMPDDPQPGHPRPGRRQRAVGQDLDAGVVAEKNRDVAATGSTRPSPTRAGFGANGATT